MKPGCIESGQRRLPGRMQPLATPSAWPEPQSTCFDPVLSQQEVIQ